MKLSILICTIDEKINLVKKNLLPDLKGVYEIIISHQITKKELKPEKEFLEKNISYFYYYEKGLSKNRNNALKKATWDFCHICDDDLIFVKDFQKIIKRAYEKNNFDVITFPILNKNLQKVQNKNKTWFLSKFWIMQIISWWITFKLDKIKEKKIFFNEEFWLGSEKILWEENIFLRDCQKKWLKVFYFDEAIVLHKNKSTGFFYNEKIIFSRIYVLKNMYSSFLTFFLIFYLSIFHYKIYKEEFSFIAFLRLNFKYFLESFYK